MEAAGKNTAIVMGGTGLVGSELLQQLLEDPAYQRVVAFLRRPTGIEDPKLEERIIDFDRPEDWKDLIKGDVLFSAFGTTIKKAGGKKRQYMVDYTYQYRMAKAAAENGVKNYVLVSSTGADPNSTIFYNRMKGELDRDVQKLAFEHISILKPSILDGHRKEKRRGEKIGLFFGRTIAHFPVIRKYRPIKASIVAKAMRKAVQKPGKLKIFESEEIFKLAKD